MEVSKLCSLLIFMLRDDRLSCPRMPTEDKLVEARFFLRKLDSSVPGSDEYKHFLSAFLASTWGVPDWLLQEYAGKYFGLTLEDRVNESIFKLAARVKQDPRADQFFLWYTGETGILLNQDPWKLLHRKRIEVVHRGGQLAFIIQLLVPQTVSLGGHASLLGTGSFMTSSAPPTQTASVPQWTPPVQQSSSEVFFLDYQSETVNSLCNRFMQKLEDFVRDARARFP